MKTAAIICELNPLHTGHKKLIDYTRTIADRIICIMSGNFTQRGLPACADKYSRAKHAVLAGADLVVELPTIYATAAAENFALGGVKIANKLNADILVFGSECGDIDKLNECARMLDDVNINKQIVVALANGVSYPKAVSLATDSDVFDKPNNVLAIEYIRAIRKTKSSIIPITVKREDNYNGAPEQFASSSSLRNDKSIRGTYTYDFVIADINDKIEEKYCELTPAVIALYGKEDLRRIEGVTEGLENRIYNADKNHGYEAMMESIKTKRYTRLKLQRIILNALLSVTKEDVNESRISEPCVKVLAVKSDSVTMLSGIENLSDNITDKADRLYYALSGKEAPARLVKV